MNVGSKDFLVKWCEDREFLPFKTSDIRFDAIKTYYVKVPAEYPRVVVLLDCLMSYEASDNFDGALLFVRDWGVGGEDATIDLFNRLRAAMSNDQHALDEAPVSIFDKGERDELYCLLLLTLLGGWDATVVPNHGRYIFYLSHLGIVDIALRDEHAADLILEWLEKMQFVAVDNVRGMN